MKKLILSFGLAILCTLAWSQDTKLLRFPDINGNKIVFSYSGDLYTCSTDGGTARRLTSHKGYEMFPKYSPDGSKIAFTAQYDGNTEVYIMPSDGGEPVRLTTTATLDRDDIADRMGPNNIVLDWTPDGKSVIFRSRLKSFNSFVGQLFKISVDGGIQEQLPVPRGSWCSLDNTGTKMVYNRVFREFRTWKYYRGGMADDLWLYDFNDHSTTRLFSNDAQDIQPMWIEDKVYFISDRDRTMNLFSFDFATKETSKLTDFNKYDIKYPGHDDKSIIFEKGGEIYVYDLSSSTLNKIGIQIHEDFQNSRLAYKDASKNISGIGISPDAKRVAGSARGEIFTVPAKDGITKRLTESNGAHDRDAEWSPDGKYIAFWSDMNGEYEIYLQDKDGKNDPIQLTKDNDTYPYEIKWSPDSKKIIWSDKKLRLRYIDIDSKDVTEVKKSEYGEIRDFTWSPDSKWIAYSDEGANRFSRVYLYSLKDNSTTSISSEWYMSSSPEFSACGKALFFISRRDFNPIYSETEWNHAYRDMYKIYYVTLAKDIKDPLAPKNDIVKIVSKKEKETESVDTPKSKDLKIDLDGIQDRLGVLPVPAASYWNLNSANKKLYFNQYNLKHGVKLSFFDFNTRKIVEVGENMGYQLSNDKKHMLVSSRNKYYIIDIPSGKAKLDNTISMSDMKIWVNLHEEWEQIYNEAWRQMRDFFYDPAMHGVDWIAMKDKYAALLPYVNHRNDLTYIIGELIGELNIGHAYVGGGDRDMPEKIYTGMLGAEFEKDESGYFKITELLDGKNWQNNCTSPLTKIGMDVNNGDYVVAINGKSTKEFNNIFDMLLGKANEKISININSKASEKGATEYIVTPSKDESQLYYHKWVQGNIKKVNEATNGKVGYIHIPDMVTEGLNEFIAHFYPQLTKEALIIDDRGNGGGNVSPMIIERLRRELSMMAMTRNTPEPETRPRGMQVGPKVLLVNQYSASDGDLFPYQFRKNNIGKIIGVRTWGGVVGIRGSLPFIDGGTLTRPEFAHYASDGSGWIIEGHGVEPDIEVINDPWKEFNGEDEQLNKAIEVVLEELQNNPVNLPNIPKFPDKSK